MTLKKSRKLLIGQTRNIKLFKIIFFSFWVFFHERFTNHRTAGEGGGHFFNSSLLPLPPASQTLRHQPGDCCRELTSAHSQQPHTNRDPFIFERRSLTTKLCQNYYYLLFIYSFSDNKIKIKIYNSMQLKYVEYIYKHIYIEYINNKIKPQHKSKIVT